MHTRRSFNRPVFLAGAGALTLAASLEALLGRYAEARNTVARAGARSDNGRVFRFAQNNVMLRGEKNGIRGDFTMREFAGSCYSPDGQWLFFNVQTPGFTVAVTGRGERGGCESIRLMRYSATMRPASHSYDAHQ